MDGLLRVALLLASLPLATPHVIGHHCANPFIRATTPTLGAKNKKGSFVEYAISGDATEMFPLPADRDAIGVHKKHYPDGVPASKAEKTAKPYVALMKERLPGLDLSWAGLRVLHVDPPVLIADNFFTDEECDAYAALRELDDPGAVHQLEQSATFGGGATAQARTSTTWFVAYDRVANLLAKASALLGVDDLERFEEPQLVKYAPGQYFNWHYDAVPPTLLSNGGQRLCTLLVYLNDVPDGGRTSFRDLRAGGTGADGKPLRLAVAPKKGRAILFCPANAAADGTPDERTLHAGEPTEHGEDKWIAQLWLHEKSYGPSVPKGSSQSAAADKVHSYAKEHGLKLAVPA